MTALLTHLPRARHALSAEQCRALKILSAAGQHGCAGATLLGHGFRVGMLADLVGDGLATARRETMRVDKRKITIARISITDAGRQAIKGQSSADRRHVPPSARRAGRPQERGGLAGI